MMCVHMCARVYIYMHIVYSCRFYSETKREINVIENNKSNSDIISKYIFLFYEISNDFGLCKIYGQFISNSNF